MKFSTTILSLIIGYLLLDKIKLIYFFKKEKENILKLNHPKIETKVKEAFVQGNRYTWSLIQVCIYDMYKNMELLDFISIIESITNKLNKFNQNTKLRDKKINEFVNDVKNMGFINRTRPDGTNN